MLLVVDGGVVSLQLRHASFDHGRRRSAARSSRGRKRFQLKLKPRTPPELVRECGLEWTGFDVDPAQAYLGLSLATALQALDVTAWDADRLASVPRALTGAADPVTPIFPATADPFFRGDWLRVRGSLATEAGFAILVVTVGTGELISSAGRFPVAAGTCVLLPYGAGPVTFTGSLDAIRCRPPAPR